MTTPVHTLQTSEDLRALLALSQEKPVMILKHSTRCPISAFAQQEFQRYADDAASRGVECAMVLVVEEKSVSGEVAKTLAVRHQSPQAILVKNRQAVWNDSHEGVNAPALVEAEAL